MKLLTQQDTADLCPEDDAVTVSNALAIINNLKAVFSKKNLSPQYL